MPLPCPVERMWPMHPEGAGAGLSGLILQRAAAGSETVAEPPATAQAGATNDLMGEMMGDAAQEPGESLRLEMMHVSPLAHMHAVPTLFTLTHPLDELKPLGAVVEISEAVDNAMPAAPPSIDAPSLAGASPGLACNAREALLFAHEDLPLAVSFNSESGLHTIWQLHR